jgi:hypothetical protein
MFAAPRSNRRFLGAAQHAGARHLVIGPSLPYNEAQNGGALMIRSREPKDVLLRSSQLILYLGFVFLWFKGNIAPLKSILISPLVPGIPLLVLTGWRLFLKLKRRGFRPPIVSRKILWAVAAIALTALAFRIPYLLNNQGLVTSDDAITGLMGKHIADGRLAPICFYGQLYIGSLGSHIYALMFRLFGYSVVCFKLTTVLLYLGFLLVHFLLLKELFPFPFAVLVSLSYGLPLGELVGIGFDESLICPGVLLLGTAIVYLGYRATCQKRDDLIPWNIVLDPSDDGLFHRSRRHHGRGELEIRLEKIRDPRRVRPRGVLPHDHAGDL